MKWLSLHNKIGKQPIRVIRKSDVQVLIDDELVKVTGIKFMVDGTPYLITDCRERSIS